MLKKTINYIDYNGNERNDIHYFNLSKPELAEMQLSTKGGLQGLIQGIIDADDQAGLIKIFKDIILKSYGEKSADGLHFTKTRPDGTPAYMNFIDTEAYATLYMELATDDVKAAEFINGIVPKDVAEAMDKVEIPEIPQA